MDSAISALRQTLDVLRSTERNLSKTYEAELSSVKALDDYLIREELLLGNIRRLVETHDSVLAQLGDFQLASQELAGGRTTVRVQLLDGPKLMPQPVWPRKKQFLGLSAMIGLVVGMLLVVAVDRGRSGGTPTEQPGPDVLAGPPAPRQLPRVGGKHG